MLCSCIVFKLIVDGRVHVLIMYGRVPVVFGLIV